MRWPVSILAVLLMWPAVAAADPGHADAGGRLPAGLLLPHVAASPASVHGLVGIDVYEGDGAVSFARTHAAFTFVKATEGLTYRDPRFNGTWRALAKLHALRGAYHFARPQPGRSAKAEADAFVAAVTRVGGLHQGDLPPVLDVEWVRGLSRSQLQSWISSWLTEVKHRTGRVPMIYTGAWFWNPNVGCVNFGVPVWTAAYTSRPIVPCGWKTFAFWQFTDKGSFGDGKHGDLSVFNGSRAQLDALRGLPVVVKKPPGKPKPKPVKPPAVKPIPKPGLVACTRTTYVTQGDSGRDAKVVQTALNRHGFHLRIDGDFGSGTAKAVRVFQTRSHLGNDGVVGPRTRSKLGLSLCKGRGALVRHTVGLDGTPTYEGLALALQDARAHGWPGVLSSSDRRVGVAEAFGRRSQAALFACFVARIPGCNPANPPGRSTHEQRSDGQAYSGPVGRVLRYWQLGLDVTYADTARIVLNRLGYVVWRPYPDSREAHHLNFRVSPDGLLVRRKLIH